MKGRLIVISELAGGQQAAALLEDGRLSDLIVDPPEDDPRPRPGAIYRARVDRPLKGLGGAILLLPDGQTGFLREARGLSQGQSLLVQVSTYAEPQKAIPLTTKLLFKSRYVIVTPDRPGLNISRTIRDEDERDRLRQIIQDSLEGEDAAGLILRSAADGASEEDVLKDFHDQSEIAAAVLADGVTGAPECLIDAPTASFAAWRDWPDVDEVIEASGAFEDHGIWDEIDRLRDSRISLGRSGSIYVEPTRALVAVDVNTGGDTSPAAGMKANLDAVRELPRQLRLRGLGGQIVIDAAPMPKKDRRQIEAALRTALKADPVDTSIVGWTQLGHLELTRRRERPALMEILPK